MCLYFGLVIHVRYDISADTESFRRACGTFQVSDLLIMEMRRRSAAVAVLRCASVAPGTAVAAACPGPRRRRGGPAVWAAAGGTGSDNSHSLLRAFKFKPAGAICLPPARPQPHTLFPPPGTSAHPRVYPSAPPPHPPDRRCEGASPPLSRPPPNRIPALPPARTGCPPALPPPGLSALRARPPAEAGHECRGQ